jgi:predicted N-acetyltransferase YhbS
MFMRIRQERLDDYAEVYKLVKGSFATDPQSDGTEADYLNNVREKDSFIPELSLLAEDDNGKIVGQIVLYKTTVTMQDKVITELVLSPICVHPDYFRHGIARAMMEKAFEIADSMGYNMVFLCGEPRIYRKLGFVPSHEHNIYHINDTSKNADWCMVRELVNGASKNISGTVDIV